MGGWDEGVGRVGEGLERGLVDYSLLRDSNLFSLLDCAYSDRVTLVILPLFYHLFECQGEKTVIFSFSKTSQKRQ